MPERFAESIDKEGGTMRRIVLSLALVAIVSFLVCGVALALPELVGTARDDTLRGTAKAEAIRALAGQDTIYAKGGNDTVNAGAGSDTAYGGPGRDRINTASDQAKDYIYCRTGYDTLVANENDRIEGTPAKDVVLQGLATACERVALRP
jgi:hypothetical protein